MALVIFGAFLFFSFEFTVHNRISNPAFYAPLKNDALLPDSPPSKATTLEVRADTPWTDAHLHVLPGQRISINTTGLVRITDRSIPGFVMESPDGQPMGQIIPGTKNARNLFPAPNFAAWSLIGRIGNSSLFHVGSQGTFVAEREGELFLGINGYQFAGNSGAWQAMVTVDAAP